jgi:hypothetical protein
VKEKTRVAIMGIKVKTNKPMIQGERKVRPHFVLYELRREEPRLFFFVVT